jgi:hypothetical protein
VKATIKQTGAETSAAIKEDTATVKAAAKKAAGTDDKK